MVLSHDQPGFTFEGPATYRILVQGALDATYARRLAGMTIETVRKADGPMQTSLVGLLSDQAELRGVLETIYGLHLPVISVTKLEDG